MKKILLAMDIGNVCVKIDHGLFPKQLGIGETPEAMKELLREFEFGHLDGEKEFLERAGEIFHNKFSCEKIREAFNAIIIEPVPGMEELISNLEKFDFEARFFSDISLTHLTRTHHLFPAAQFVPDGMFSFIAGAQKPAEEMFAAFEEKFGAPALYVDDRLELIEAARKRNWNAIQFTTADALQEALK